MASMTEEMYAFSRIESTFHRTKDLLWPFKWKVWLRLALIALFIGSGSSAPNFFQYQFNGNDITVGTIDTFPSVAPAAVLGIIGVVLAIIALWLFISATMQFAFVDMVSSGDIHIRRFFRDRLDKGVRLFVFEIVVAAVMLIAMVALILILFGSGEGHVSTKLMLVTLIPVTLVIAIIFGLISLLTTDFVVPIMISEDCGVLKGWQRLASVITSRLWQTIVYVITRFVLGLVAAVVQMILAIIAMLVIAIPFVVIGILLFTLFQVPNLTLLLVLGIPYIIILVPVILLIAVPFATFFRYYALLVLEGLRPEYGLLPE